MQPCVPLACLSFQEPLEEEEEDEKGPNPPMMVPVADILNHVANHNANLEYSPVSAKLLHQALSQLGSVSVNLLGMGAQQSGISAQGSKSGLDLVKTKPCCMFG